MKYFSKKVKLLGHTFDSKREANRYLELLALQKQGKVRNIRTQERFEILPKQTKMVEVKLKTKTKVIERTDELAVHYHCDFFYYDILNDQWVIEDVKSPMTAQIRDYPLRRKLIKLMVKRKNAELGKEMYIFNEVL